MIRKYFLLVVFSLSFAFTLYANSQWQLVWSDEFNSDGPLDETIWNFETGFVRNLEAQWYQSDNAFCKDGYLVIEARKENNRPNPLYLSDDANWPQNRKQIEYTSSSVNTAGKKEFLFGRFEIRARIPVVSGAWPAIWTLGSGIEWPSCGEIDIMEYYQIKGEPHILANAAWGNDKQWNATWNSKAVPYAYFTSRQPDWASQFHIWRMDWDEEAIRLYLDDELLNEVSLSTTQNGIIGNYDNPFLKPQYLLLNLALGGINGGVIDENALPMRYEIDYVRVYQKEKRDIASGQLWFDSDGNHINAHGGGIIHHEGKYYWFGEHRPTQGFSTQVGVTCYSSPDLLHWYYEGVALDVDTLPNSTSDIVKGCIIERPKVIYNKQTGKFVMWFHLELKDQGYAAARAGLAVSDSPTGPYQFVASNRINPGIYPQNMSKKERKAKTDPNNYKTWWEPKWYDAVNRGMFVKRDLAKGQMSRDMTLFVDNDDKAYHIYSSEENLTLHIAELSDDYQSHSGRYIRIYPGGHNEAPAIFKKDGIYWLITSGCTGWEPNEARLFSATSIWGPWQQYDNPCVGIGSNVTFGAQSTYIFRIQGTESQFVFMADVWRPKSLIDSRYVWLPIAFDANNIPYISWKEHWSPIQYSEEQKI